jgi:hypothetical protein
VKHSLRVIGFVTAISVMSAILPPASAQTQPAKSTPPPATQAQPERTPARRPKVRPKGAAIGAATGGSAAEGAVVGQAITVVRIGEPAKEQVIAKAGVRYSTNVTR